MTNLWLKVVGNLLCKKLHGSNSINFERDRKKEEKRSQQNTHNDLLLLVGVTIKIRITTSRAAKERTNMFHFAHWMHKMDQHRKCKQESSGAPGKQENPVF
jgi:hypothetical protein